MSLEIEVFSLVAKAMSKEQRRHLRNEIYLCIIPLAVRVQGEEIALLMTLAFH